MSRDQDVPADHSGLSRRQFAGVLAAGGTGVVAGCSSVDFTGGSEGADQPETGDTGLSDGPKEPSQPPGKAMPLDEALACDADMTKSFDAQMRLAPPSVPTHAKQPSRDHPEKATGKGTTQRDTVAAGDGGTRRGAVQVTSEGAPTQDYPCLSVDLRTHELTLGELATSTPLTYDYAAGDAHEPAAPGQVFLTLRTAAKHSKQERVWVAYRTLADSTPTAGWQRRPVSQELTRDGWRALEVDPGLIDVDDERVRNAISATVIESEIGTLRSQEPFRNLRQRFGDDTEVLAVTIGTGNVSKSVTLDAYFSTLRIGTTRRPLPAMLTMGLTVDQTADPIEIRLQVPTETPRVTFAKGVGVDPTSVHLSPYASIARPIDGTDAWQAAVKATDVEVVSETALVARFPGALTDFGDAPMVWGAVDHPQGWPLTFLGVRDSKWND